MIAILTDFGTSGSYIGQMRVALHAGAPGIEVVDLFPDLPVCNVRASAFLLPAYTRFLPVDTVCLCVVDPGVGTDRKALALRIDERWFVGPDNGLFSVLIRRAQKVEAFEICWRPAYLSESFHGRDLFAPVVARLTNGDVSGLTQIDISELTMPVWPGELPEVIYIDHYGNLVTGMRGEAILKSAVLDIDGQRCRYSRTFAEADSGQLFWYENSNGLVEIALNQGDAAAIAGACIGSQVQIPD